MNYYIGADLGTSALKLLLINSDGEILRSVTNEYPVYYPKPTYSEQDPRDWWQDLRRGIPELIQGYNPEDIKAIGISGQMHGLVMLDEYDEVIKAGGLTGGFNFDSKTRRPYYTHEDMFHAFILGMDTFALGLINAAKIIEDGRIDKFIEDRYSSYKQGIGAKIVNGETSLEELAAYADSMGAPELPSSGRQEYLQSIVNQIIFG